MQSLTSTLRTLAYICRLRFPRYPPHFFPVFLLVKFLQEFEFKFNTRTLNFQLVPVPNRYFDFLCREHDIQSDHTLFISRRVFDFYIYQPDVNFVNLQLSDASRRSALSHAERVIKEVVESSKAAEAGTSLYQVFPLHLPPNKILVKENSYWNFVERHKLEDAGTPVLVNLSMLQAVQKVPPIATKCNVFLINSPYEMPAAFVDEALNEYFRRPRLLYRNHTYRVDLTEELLGHFTFCEHFQLIAKLKRLYVKCVHLESRSSVFDTCAIVTNRLSTLNLTTTINYRVPSVNFDAHFLTVHPYGLHASFASLRAAVRPFLDDDSAKFLKSRHIHPVFGVCAPRGSGKRRIVQSVADHFGLHTYFAESGELMTGLASTTEQKILHALHRASGCAPLLLAINDFELFGRTVDGHEDERVVGFFRRELAKVFAATGGPLVVVCLCNGDTHLSGLFLETVAVKPLDRDERFRCLLWLHQRDVYDRLCLRIKNGALDNYVTVKRTAACGTNDLALLRSMAEQTTGFSFGDLRVLYDRSTTPPNANGDAAPLAADSFKRELSAIKRSFSDSIGTPEIPRVLWDDIGGLADLKHEIQSSIALPLRYAHLLGGRRSMRRSGVLLFGPPGTGKTLIAKAVATECNLSFISVQGPELLNMYVGQSEQNVRDVFAKARACAPSVIFLDELDSLAPNRGVAGDSGGVMDRVVSQLLSEMDGVEGGDEPGKPVFVLGATNRPDLIDKQLLRPGRFDKMLYVGPCRTVDDKELVLRALTRKFRLKRDVSVRRVAELVTCDVTGADLYSICSNAWLCAVRRHVKSFESGRTAEEEMTAERVVVGVDDFRKSMERFVSSLNQVDMEYFARLQASFA